MQKSVTGVEPQISATVITVRTILQPQKRAFTHSIVIAEGRARSGDEVDRWRLFDLEHNRVTVVDDLARTYYIEAARADERGGSPQLIATGAKQVLQGVEATQYLIRLGGYQRQLWIGSPPSVPPNLSAMMHSSDDPLSKLPGFPLIDHAELPYGKSTLIVDRRVVKIEQRNVPKSWLTVRSSYKEITAPGANHPPVSSPQRNQSIPAAE